MNNEEREIDLKILFANAFIKWRRIILVTIICGLLAVGYGAVKIMPSYSALQSTYEHDLETYQTNLTYSNKQISDTEAQIQKLNEYSENSIKANINPYSEAQSVVTIYITSGETTDAAKQITQAYQVLASSGMNYDSAASTLGKTAQLINEVVTAKSNSDANTVTITVIGQTTNQTETIIKSIISQVNDAENAMTVKYGRHSIIVGDPATQVVTDTTLLSSTYQTSDQMLSVNVTMNGVVNKISSLKTALKTMNSSKPVAPVSALKTTAKKLVNYLSFGLAIGFLVYITILVLMVIHRKTIISEDELKKQYGLKILTLVPRKNLCGRTRFDQALSRTVDHAYGIDDKVAFEKAAANISAYAGEMKTLLVINDNVNQDVNEIIANLKAINPEVKYEMSSDVNESAAELNKLKNADGVIIVAERNVTRFDNITRSVETVKNWGKEIIGSIVL